MASDTAGLKNSGRFNKTPTNLHPHGPMGICYRRGCGGLEGVRVAIVKGNVGHRCGLVVEGLVPWQARARSVVALYRLARKIRHLPEQSSQAARPDLGVAC